MLRSIALVISVVFQPLLMPTLVFGLIFFGVPQATTIPEEFKLRLFYLIVLSTLLIPMITVVALRLSGMIKSLHFPEVKDRTIPFLIVSLYFILTTYFLHQRVEFDPILWNGMAVITLSVIALTVITWFWKMSAHMTGAGGLVAVVIVLGLKFHAFEILYPLLLSLILSGAIASSRLYLQAHRPPEVYAGFFTGLVICWAGFSWILG